ncbi:MAG: hypothetical protein R3F62_01715 [Planctomycetota bacterium]
MADARLAELERSWLASGRLEDEVAFLRERLRAGTLDREQLELARACDHPAATALLGPAPRPRSFSAWLRQLDDAGHATRVCAALAALRAPPVRLGGHRQRLRPAAREVLRAGEAWLACPCPSCLVRVRVAGERAEAEVQLQRFDAPYPVDLRFAAAVAELIGQGAARRIGLSTSVMAFLQGCQERLVATQVSLRRTLAPEAQALRQGAERRLWRRVERALGRWALER